MFASGRRQRGGLALVLAALALVLAACGSGSGSGTTTTAAASSSSTTASSGSSTTASSGSSTTSGGTSSKGPIIIGAVIDESNYMKSFDDPALYAAEIEAKKINSQGGVGGRKIEFKVYNDKLDPSLTRSDALAAVSAGAQILWVTCDVDLATPAVQVGLSKHLLTVSPCIGTNQMGPARFGPAGKLAFTFGNAPQNDGSALARLLLAHGWKTATVVTDKSLAYFIDVCQYFTTAFTQLGGHVVSQLTYTAGDHTAGQVGNRAAQAGGAATVLCSTSNPDLPTFVTAERTAGNAKPIVGPWAIDGGFWEPSSPTISNNIWITTYASSFGDDPNPKVNTLVQELAAEGHRPVTGGFVTGPTAVEGIVNAIQKAHGSLDGSTLAGIIQSYSNFPTISGNVSFSTTFHSVVGRSYRVIEVTKDKPHYVGMQSPGPVSFVTPLKP